MIPPIMHYTWRDEQLPEPFRLLMHTWQQHHPYWEHRLWTDTQNRSFIATHFPEFLATYDAYPEHIQRVDAVRYLILYHMGGIFIDLDMECFRSIEPLIQNQSCVLGRESQEHCQWFGREQIISNCWMAVTPQHPFLKKVYDRLQSPKPLPKGSNRVLHTTGPYMFTEVYDEYTDKEAIRVLPADYLHPLHTRDVERFLCSAGVPPDLQQKLEQAYGMHYYWGTYWKPNIQLIRQRHLFLQQQRKHNQPLSDKS